MELTEAMRTTFACREFTDDPVPDEVLHRILDEARFAPSGGNRQGGHVVVVRDPAIRRRLGELAQPTLRVYAAQAAAGETPPATSRTPRNPTPPGTMPMSPAKRSTGVISPCVQAKTTKPPYRRL